MKSKKHEMKHHILKSIKGGNNTAKLIFKDISYPHHIDSLYQELDYLHKHNFVSRKRVNRESIYSLTKRGELHADNPYVDADRRRKRREEAEKLKNEFSHTIYQQANELSNIRHLIPESSHSIIALNNKYNQNDLIFDHDIPYAVLSVESGRLIDFAKKTGENYIINFMQKRGIQDPTTNVFLYHLIKLNKPPERKEKSFLESIGF